MKVNFSSILLLTLPLICWSSEVKYIELSHDFSEETLHWPTSKPFKITDTHHGQADSFYVSARDYASNEHVGTHVDAPNHFAKEHWGVSEIPLDRLIGPAIKIDVSDKVNKDHDYLISIEDIKQWESVQGIIPPRSIVLLSTGYAKFWGNPQLYAGTNKVNATHDLHFPGLDQKAAHWLVNERKIKAIGIDTYGIDRGQSKQFEAHQILTKNDIPIFENVADMEQVPAKGFKIYALPMKIKGGTGAPLHIIAQVE